ncbi:glycosyltransferase family 2 protein [Actinomyces trachealis]|uniref:glycosyltransferase family 2 protein n=1 Tax=Actinomyces trachealis TaxID=2763540 RepID=UPI00189296E9|nr:glycosyltransferase family 2 protein [Actinomyces trachealis]
MSTRKSLETPTCRPTACIVVVNWRQPELTIRACESLRPQLQAGDRLLVVDNASGDGSAQRLREAGLEVVETAENLGFGAGANAGAQGLREQVLVLLNNDAVTEPGFLDALTAPLGPDGPADLAATTALILLAGRWRPAHAGEAALTGLDGRRWHRVGPQAEARGEGLVLVNSTGNQVDGSGNGYDRDWLTRADQLHSPAEVFGICGGACALRASAWHELGGFREDLFMYYEDTELSWRIREAGWRVEFVSGAVVHHEHAASSGTDSPMFLRVNTRNRILVAAAHGPRSHFWRGLARTVLRAARHGCCGPVAQGLGQAVRELLRQPAAVPRSSR